MQTKISFPKKVQAITSILLLSFFITKADVGKIDSLLKILKVQKADTAKINTWAKIVEEWQQQGYYDKALESSVLMRSLALRVGYAQGIGSSWLLSGDSYYRKHEYDSAFVNLTKALSVFKTLANNTYQAKTLIILGQVSDSKAQYDHALKFYYIALDLLADSPTNNYLRARIFNCIGNAYFNKGSYEVALKFYLQSYNATDQENQPFSSPLNNIGVIYAMLIQYEEAHKYFLLYLESIKNKPNKKQERADVFLNIGECNNKLNNYTVALTYLKEAIRLYTELNDRRGLSLSYSNLAEAYHLLQQNQLAEQYYQESIKLAMQIKNDEVLLNPLIGITKLYIQTGNINLAEQGVVEARNLSEQIKSKLWLEKALLLSSKVDSLKGNQSASFGWYRQYVNLHDSLFNEQKSKLVIRMRELYETEKKEKEIQLLKEEKRFDELKLSSERSLFFISAGFLLMAVFVFAYWAVSKTRASKILKQQKETITTSNMELKQLLDKIELQNKTLAQKNEILEELHREKDGLIGIVAHDLRSPLTRIIGLINLVEMSGKVNPEQQEMLSNIKKVCNDGNSLIRDLIDINQYETIKAFDPENIELTHFVASLLKGYMQMIRDKKLTLHYNYDYSKRVWIKTDKECLTRILDNLITNAVKFSPMGKNLFITIDTENMHETQILIRDEGPGFKEEDTPHLFKKFKKLSARPTGGESSTGLGLSIVKSLVDRLNGNIIINSTPGKGAEVKVWFRAEVSVKEPNYVL